MFHTYVTASTGNKIDINRAGWLMDDELVELTYKHTNGIDSPWRYIAGKFGYTQVWWEIYCKLHQKKYGEPFVPDVDPAWDQK